MADHLAPGELLDFTLHLVSAERREQLEAHLADCDACQAQALAELREEDAPASPEAPMQIGRFTVRRVVGAGAMGLVFEAHDPQLDRRVALKLRRTAAGTEERRLLDEARAMARLASPHIVAIHEVGHEGDTEFLVIEFVEGTTLRQQLERPGASREALLQLVVQAGHGLAAAHQAGVVHRDFKPENVLVDADGRARVTDFGLAAFKPRVGATGTPAYMAPELTRGEAATQASDQYSFCVTAFEALTGARPATPCVWPRGAPASARVREAITRGLSPRPDARFPSMEVLLAELEPRPRLTPGRAAALAAGVALLIGGAWAVATRAPTCQGAEPLIAAVWNDDARARGASAFLATGAPYAQQSWTLTRDALDGWARRWAEARTDACLAARVRGEQTERQLLLRLECLDRRLTEFSTLTTAFTQADEKVVARAQTAVTALSPLDACAQVKQLEDRRAPPPALEAEARALAGQVSRGRALVAAGLGDAARRELAPASTRSAELQLAALEADAHGALGELEVFEHRFDEARQEFELALYAAEVAGDDAGAARAAAHLVSIVGWRQGRAEEARTLARLASGIVQRIGGDAATQARIEEGLGDTAWEHDEHSRALEAFRRSLALFRQAAGDETLDVVRVRASIGWVLTELGDLEAARRELEAAQQLHERLLGAAHPLLAGTWNALSLLATEERDYARALACSRRAVELQATVPSRLPPARATLAGVLTLAGRPAETLELVVALGDDVRRERHLEALVFRARLHALIRLGRAQEAWVEGSASLAEQERKLGRDHPTLAALVVHLSEAAFDLGRWKDAAELSDRALASKAAMGGVETPRRGELLLRAARAHLALGDATTALPLAERALAALLRGVVDRRAFAEARLTLALALRATGGDATRVESLLREAVEDAAAAGDSTLSGRIEQAR